MDMLIAVINGILVVCLLIVLCAFFFARAKDSIVGTGKDKDRSVLGAIGWGFLALIHAYGLIDLFAGWLGFDWGGAGAPPSVASVYTTFVASCTTLIGNFIGWIGSLFNR